MNRLFHGYPIHCSFWSDLKQQKCQSFWTEWRMTWILSLFHFRVRAAQDCEWMLSSMTSCQHNLQVLITVQSIVCGLQTTCRNWVIYIVFGGYVLFKFILDHWLVEDIDYATNFNDFLTELSVNMINLALLSLCSVDLDYMIADNLPPSDDVALAESLSVAAENSPLFVSSTDDSLALSDTSSGENPEVEMNSFSTSSEDFQDKNPQPAGSSDSTMSLPTLLSKPPFPAVQGAIKTNHHISKSKQFKVTKTTGAQQKSQQKKSLMNNSQVQNQLESTNLLMVRDAPDELSNLDIQRALETDKGLIEDWLSDLNSCIWKENGFWSENALNLPKLTDCSAEERFCQVFRYVNRLTTCSSDQELQLCISHTLLYLSFESLTWQKQTNLKSRKLKNPGQCYAATLTANYLLEHLYQDTWNAMNVQMKQKLWEQLHDWKRQDGRWWQTTEILNLGALLSCSSALATVM